MLYERKFIVASFILVVLLMGLIIFLTPVANSGYQDGGVFNLFWLQISDSGKATGTILLVVTVALLALFRLRKEKQAYWKVIVFAIGFLLTLKIFAQINEYYLKPYLGIARPSFERMAEKGIIDLKTFYLDYASKEARRAYLEAQVAKAEVQKVLQGVDPEILEHWVYETGFSLPSGHTQNAFIVAVVLCYVLFRLGDKRLQMAAYILMLWAFLMGLSRVALGVHTFEDVMLGGATGILIAFILIWTGVFDYLFPSQEQEVSEKLESKKLKVNS
jgi:phosphatidylglycerophosphatase B